VNVHVFLHMYVVCVSCVPPCVCVCMHHIHVQKDMHIHIRSDSDTYIHTRH